MSPASSARDRMVAAAYELFEEHGYDVTTVDQIAERAGVGRTTFFRMLGSKEAAIFPEHEILTARISARLDAATPRSRQLAIVEAARTVLDHYLAEGDLARARYRLTRTVPALRQREIAGMQRYQQIFREHLTLWLGEQHALLAEVAANAVVTAHNHVLRRWLRGLSEHPHEEFEEAMDQLTALLGTAIDQAAGEASVPARATAGEASGSIVLVVRSDLTPDQAAEAVRSALRNA
ncbi:TetR/AcrR family transcriptional regulator [Nocardioides sp. Bht2]|uniref:TetR/AcrR family transcriptional regulator n=1 Tax=Nocardioides sp. Bht2 TaxID=3392297 RepID=UPI0039B6CBAE